ncbi:MAG TPA: FAD-binding protein, partial [Pseudobdellovibrionaceae bacterium]|nr:FAD-binding protein [Pseudobdellovibrionaceae bacterium]
MTKVYENIKLPIDGSLEEHLEWLAPNHGPYRILRQSVDARTRHSPHFIYSVEVADAGEALPVEEISVEKISRPPRDPILIIGSGPAGLFAALRLVERGMKCILFERGSSAEKRMIGINRFWRYGQLDSRNNVCYGEGGAGLYSDGKLITRIKSPHIPYVL